MPGPLPKYTIIMTGDQEKELEQQQNSQGSECFMLNSYHELR